jgi:hypothetical protein
MAEISSNSSISKPFFSTIHNSENGNENDESETAKVAKIRHSA